MQKFFVSLLSLLTLTLIVAVVMAIRVSIPQKKDIDISYEEAFKQAKDGNAKIVPILIRAWSDDSRTGNDNWGERWGEGETPNSKHAGEQYDEFSKKVMVSLYYIGAKNTLPYIFKELKNYDESKRKMAKRVIQLLISRGIVDKKCLPVIIEGLKDKNDEIRHISTIYPVI